MKRISLAFLLVLFLAFTLPETMCAKVVHLLPRPQQVSLHQSSQPFVLGRSVALTDATNNAQLIEFLSQSGCTIDENVTTFVTVTLVEEIEGAYDFNLYGFPNEAYRIEISDDKISITAVSETGVTRAAQTLMQLAQGWEGESPVLEALTLTDWPAFKVRGFMHDVGRSYVSVEQLKRQIDLLSKFKLNLFHWHLTENQAWRFEVKQYPQLTSSASMTRFAGQFYTQEQCREVQDYAWERGVVVIPEIDMPGHSAAFKRAMGHSMQTDEGVQELKNILEEVAQVFDKAPYIHIGADEETISYPNFLKIMIDKVHGLGRKVMVWNPIRGVDIASLGVDMTQMWSSSGKAINGVANLDCRYNYTNHFDVFADLVGIYKSNIYYKQRGDATVPGFISAPWNDRKTPSESDILRQNNVYAATIASGERAWIGGGKQYIEVGGTVLPNSGEEYDEFADWERRFLFHKVHTFPASERALVPYVRQSNVRWHITDAMPNNGDASLVLPPETEGVQDSYVLNSTTYNVNAATGAGIYLRHTWGTVVPSLFANPQLNHTAYAWTYVYSPVDRQAGALIEFQNYGRSENDAAPDAGKWDRKGSRIWLNDEELLPPTWGNSGKSINSEVELLNENFSARKPLQVQLKQGWNKVFLKLPYVNASGVRLNKWLYTFVLTDVDGNEALEDLIYSPNQCMDINAEQVAAAISDARKLISSNTSDQPGYYPVSTAEGLVSVLDEVQKTLGQEMSAEERARQLDRISQAVADFQTAMQGATVVQPRLSTESDIYTYSLSTPLRDNRYVSSIGVGLEVVGEATLTQSGEWKFVKRAASTYDVINIADGSYLSPVGTNNTALKTTKTRPTRGWTLKASNQVGYMIVVSGSTQLNQTKSSQGYKVFNWGSGTNVDDTGCKFRVSLVNHTSLPNAVDGVSQAVDANSPYYDLSGRPARIGQQGLLVQKGCKVLK